MMLAMALPCHHIKTASCTFAGIAPSVFLFSVLGMVAMFSELGKLARKTLEIGKSCEIKYVFQ